MRYRKSITSFLGRFRKVSSLKSATTCRKKVLFEDRRRRNRRRRFILRGNSQARKLRLKVNYQVCGHGKWKFSRKFENSQILRILRH